MKKIVVKTALKTLLIAFIALIAAFMVASFGFPGKMATMCENMGAYSSATLYADLAFNYSRTTSNLARCLDDSVFAGKDENIVKYGDRLIAREDFAAYAEERSAAANGAVDYFGFVYNNLTIAKYNRGDKDGALNTAKTAMEGVSDFPVNNAYAILAIQAASASDAELCQKIYELIVELSPTAEQQNYYLTVLSILT